MGNGHIRVFQKVSVTSFRFSLYSVLTEKLSFEKPASSLI